jgi:hypothetical protein
VCDLLDRTLGYTVKCRVEEAYLVDDEVLSSMITRSPMSYGYFENTKGHAVMNSVTVPPRAEERPLTVVQIEVR